MQRPKPMPNTIFHLRRGRPYICKFSFKKGKPLWYSPSVEDLRAKAEEQRERAVREILAEYRRENINICISLHLFNAEAVLERVESSYTEKKVHALLKESSFTTRGAYLKLREWGFTKAEAYVIADSQPESQEDAARCLREWKDGINSDIRQALSEMDVAEIETLMLNL